MFGKRALIEDPAHASGYVRTWLPRSRYFAVWMLLAHRKWYGCLVWSMFAGEHLNRFPSLLVHMGGGVSTTELSFDPGSRRLATVHGSAPGEYIIRV